MEEESQKVQATKKDDVGAEEKKIVPSCEEKQSEGKAPGPKKTLTQQVWFNEKENAKMFPFFWKDRALVTLRV